MRHNEFSENTFSLFIGDYECWWCGKKHSNCLHHILGRVSNSPLNAAPLNNHECHLCNGNLDDDEVKKKLLQKTISYLLKNGYKLTEDDKLFIKKYYKYYECKII